MLEGRFLHLTVKQLWDIVLFHKAIALDVPKYYTSYVYVKHVFLGTGGVLGFLVR